MDVLSASGHKRFHFNTSAHLPRIGRERATVMTPSIMWRRWPFPNSGSIAAHSAETGALDLANIAERVIKPVFKAKGLDWKGFYPYRRWLATNLKKLGVPDSPIQAILRHESVRTTQRFYIKTAREDAMDAMKRLEEKLESAAIVQQMVN